MNDETNSSNDENSEKGHCTAAGKTENSLVRIGRRDERFDPLDEDIDLQQNQKSQRPDWTGKKRERQFGSCIHSRERRV